MTSPDYSDSLQNIPVLRCCWAVKMLLLFFFTENFISPIVGNKLVSGCRLWVGAQGGNAVIDKNPERDVASSNYGCLHMDDVTQEIDSGRPWPLPVLCSDEAECWVEAFRWGRVARLRFVQWFLIPIFT